MASGLDKLLEAGGGSAAGVAARLHSQKRPCLRQHVEYWVRRGYVPGTWAPAVAKEFNIPLHELNPQVYPKHFEERARKTAGAA
jgi:hypothetical protein